MGIQAFEPKIVSLGSGSTVIVGPVASGMVLRLDPGLISNVTTASARFSLHAHPASCPPAASNALYYEASIPANTTWVGAWSSLTLTASWLLSGQASAPGAVNIWVSGFQQT